MARLIIEVKGDQAERALKSIRTEAEKLGGSVKRMDRDTRVAEKGIKGLGVTMGSVAKIASSLGLAFGAMELLKLGKDAIKASAEFQQALTNVQAVSGATTEEFQLLKQAALEAGAATRFSPKEVTEGLYALASAGLAAKESIATLRPALDFAEAAQTDIGKATEIVVGALKVFNLEAAEATRIADVFTASIGASSLNADRLQVAMRAAGPVAASMGQSLEGTTAALAILTSQFNNGELAGTGFKSALIQLIEKQDELGVHVTDSSGSVRGFSEILQDLESTGLTAAEIVSIVGSEAGPALAALVGQGSDALREMEVALGSTGQAAETAAGQLNTLQGDLDKLKSAWQVFLITLGDSENSTIRSLVQALTALVGKLDELAVLVGIGTPIGQLSKALALLSGNSGDASEALEDVAGALKVEAPKRYTGALSGLNQAVRALTTSELDLVSARKLDDESIKKRLKEISKRRADLRREIAERAQANRLAAQETRDSLSADEEFLERMEEGFAAFFKRQEKQSLEAGDAAGEAYISAWEAQVAAGGGPLSGGPLDSPPGIWRDWFGRGFEQSREPMKEFADDLEFILADAIYSAFTTGVDWEQIGSDIGFALGSAVTGGSPIGGAVGALIGGGVAAAFTDDKAKEAAREQARIMEESARRMDELIHAVLPSLVVQVEQTFEDYRGLILTTGEAAEFGALALDNLRASIEGISTSLVDRLQAAVEFNRQAAELENAGRTTKFGTEIPGAEIEMINLADLARQLAQEFAGVNFEFKNVQATSQALQQQIKALGLSEQQTAELTQQVVEAEQIRMQQLETDVLQRLVNVLEQIPSMQNEAAKLQQQINQARFQIEVKMIEMQLNALNLMTDAFRDMLEFAKRFGEELENFKVPGFGGGGFKIPKFKGGKIGGIGKGFKGPDEAQQLIDTLERLASSPGFQTLNERFDELRKQFFGPGGFAEEARRLGVDMELVTRAFQAQRKALMREANQGIIDFLGSLQTSTLNPGGVAAQFGAAQSSFFDLLRRAQGGDLDARSQLGGAGRTFLEIARQRFGNTRRFREIFEQVQGTLGGLVGESFEEKQLSQGNRQIELLEIIAGVRPSSGNLYSFAAAEQLKQAVERQTEVMQTQHQAEVSAQAKSDEDRKKSFTDLIEAVDERNLSDKVTRPRAVNKM